MSKQPVQTRFEDEDIAELDVVAAERGTTRSDVIRDAVAAFVAMRKCRRCHGTGRERAE